MGDLFRQRERRHKAVHFAQRCALWLQQLFDQAYADCAIAGESDEPGGAEYQRVKAEWWAAGAPSEVWEFIHKSANRSQPCASENVVRP